MSGYFEHLERVWRYDEESENIEDGNGLTVGSAEPASGPLMAAAPDLLFRLEQITAYVADDRIGMQHLGVRALVEHALAAIAKAKGEK